MTKYDFDPKEYVATVQASAERILQRAREVKQGFQPEFSLTLGSGLGDLAQQIDAFLHIPYQEVNFPKLTVHGHKGELVIGYLKGVPIIGLSGRKHYYEVATEPYGMMQVIFPVHVMASLGVKIYFATNAVGGLNTSFNTGDLMIIKDHIDGINFPDPLTGPHLEFQKGDKEWRYFQPQHTEYNKALRLMFKDAAIRSGESEHVHEGIYTVRTGRTFETAATSRLLRQFGAHAVGMSVIPEVIVATNRGMETIAVSIVTNCIAADGKNATNHKEVLATLNNETTRNRLAKVFSKFFEFYALENGFAVPA